MRILVLGGTSFVGRAIVEDLLARGHEPTLFTRGKTGADLFPGVDRRTGDRESGDYTSLADSRWDGVVDVSAYVPRHLAEASQAIADPGGRYVFISTGSVYDPQQADVEQLTEASPRLAPHRETETIDGQTYGPLKVACEDDLLSLYGHRATIIRPGIVAGPHDPTDRFTYWVRRAAQGGRIAVPRPEQPVQVVDAADLARLVVLTLEQDSSVTYNAVGPFPAVSLGELVEICAAAAGSTVEVVPVGFEPGFPLALPDPTLDVMFGRSSAAARALGMPTTPLLETARAVGAWDQARGEPPLANTIAPEREQELLSR